MRLITPIVDESTSSSQTKIDLKIATTKYVKYLCDLCSDFNFYDNKIGYQGSFSPLLYFDLVRESFIFIAKFLVCSFCTRREFARRESRENMHLKFTGIHFHHQIAYSYRWELLLSSLSHWNAFRQTCLPIRQPRMKFLSLLSQLCILRRILALENLFLNTQQFSK